MKHVRLLLLLVMAGCAKGHVTTTQETFIGPLPRPTQVLVVDFAIRPDEVRLDRGVSAEVMRAASSEPVSEQLMQVARVTQAALTETLVKRLIGYGLPAARLPDGAAPPAGAVVVAGQILSIDEGNRTRRTLIGLGAGKSSIGAQAQTFYITSTAQPVFLQSFAGEADSGRAPGAVADRLATSAALTAGTHTAAELRRTGDEANADKLA